MKENERRCNIFFLFKKQTNKQKNGISIMWLFARESVMVLFFYFFLLFFSKQKKWSPLNTRQICIQWAHAPPTLWAVIISQFRISIWSTGSHYLTHVLFGSTILFLAHQFILANFPMKSTKSSNSILYCM